MATSLFTRLTRPSVLSTETSDYVCTTCRRQQSTYRRTRKALRVKPDPSFLPCRTEPLDHIIFNPPQSAPNVYHTPQKFLPLGDPRRKLHTLATTASRTLTASSTEIAAPVRSLLSAPAASSLPSVRPQYQKKYHLTPEQVDEMRKLRKHDPRRWTRVRLAEKFECSEFFVGLCCSSPAVKAEQDQALEEIKQRWGRRKTEAREMRQIRKYGWGRDS